MPELLICASLHCDNVVCGDSVYCTGHLPPPSVRKPQTVADLYPKYYKSTAGMTAVDVYAVHKLFNIQDPSGAIQHASKKLLLSGVRTGGKSARDDVREARDALNRWLELNP